MHYLCGAYKCGYPLKLVTRQLKECGSLQGQIETLLPPRPAKPDRIHFCCRYTVLLALCTPKLFTRQSVRGWWYGDSVGKGSSCYSHVNSSWASLGTQTSANLGRGLAWYYPFLIPSKSSSNFYLSTFMVKWSGQMSFYLACRTKRIQVSAWHVNLMAFWPGLGVLLALTYWW